MKLTILSLALGATVLSSVAVAQAPGRGWAQDQTRAEAQQRANQLFQILDGNRDGTVTKVEAGQALAQFTKRDGDEKPGRGAGGMERMIDQSFAGAASLTLAQFQALALARFDAADLNHDGVLTAGERQQARAAMRAVQPAGQ